MKRPSQNFEIQLRTLTLAVRVQLPLGWNTYLLFNTDIVNLVWKTDEGFGGGGGRKHCFVNFCSVAVLESLVDEGWWGGVESLI